MTPALLRLFLIFATLHAQAPCCLVYASVDSGHGPNATHVDTPACPCCRHSAPAHDDPPAREPGCPADCPDDCPCMFCSPGFVPLTDFGSVMLPPDAAFDPQPGPVAPARGHTGHRQLPDRPPRVV